MARPTPWEYAVLTQEGDRSMLEIDSDGPASFPQGARQGDGIVTHWIPAGGEKIDRWAAGMSECRNRIGTNAGTGVGGRGGPELSGGDHRGAGDGVLGSAPAPNRGAAAAGLGHPFFSRHGAASAPSPPKSRGHAPPADGILGATPSAGGENRPDSPAGRVHGNLS